MHQIEQSLNNISILLKNITIEQKFGECLVHIMILEKYDFLFPNPHSISETIEMISMVLCMFVRLQSIFSSHDSRY